MASYNLDTVRSASYNGTNLDKIVYNGVVVWGKRSFSGNSDGYTWSNGVDTNNHAKLRGWTIDFGGPTTSVSITISVSNCSCITSYGVTDASHGMREMWVQGCNDGVSWITLKDEQHLSGTGGRSASMTCTTTGYRYYRIFCTHFCWTASSFSASGTYHG